MAETLKIQKKSRKFLKIFAGFIIFLFVLIIIAYNYFTSAGFVKNKILPKVGESVNREISVGDIVLKPFSRFEASEFKITNPKKKNEPALLSFKSFSTHYKLFSFISGNPNIESLEIVEPKINVVIYYDGSTSLDGMSNGEKKAQPEKKSSGKTELPDFKLGSIIVKNGEIKITQLDKKNEIVKEVSVRQINYTLKDFEPSKDASMSMSLAFAMLDKSVDTNITDGKLELSTKLFVDKALTSIRLNNDFKVGGMKGVLKGQNAGDYSVVSKININTKDDSIELNPCSVVFNKGAVVGGKIRAAGKYNTKKGEGEFDFNVENIDKTFLNVAASGIKKMDFRDTSINQSAKIKVSENGKKILIDNTLDIAKLSIYAPEISSSPTPEMDLALKQNIDYDGAKNTVKVGCFDIKAIQSGKTIVDGNLSEPLSIDLGNLQKGKSSAPPISYNFNVNNLDLPQFQAMIPLPSGTRLDSALLNTAVTIAFENNGNDIKLDGSVDLLNLKGKAAGTNIPRMDIRVKLDTDFMNMSALRINEANVSIAEENKQPNNINLAGSCDIKSGDIALSLNMKDLALRSLQGFVPLKDIVITRGDLSGDFNIKGEKQFSRISLDNSFSLKNFSASVSGKQVRDLTLDGKLKSGVKDLSDVDLEILEVKAFALSKDAMDMKVSGKVNSKNGEGNLKIDKFAVNDNIFLSVSDFLPPDVKINSMKFDCDANIALKDKFTDITANSNFNLANLSCEAAGKKINGLSLEGKINKNIKNSTELNINNLEVAFKSGGKDAGSVALKGKINNDAGEGNIQIDTKDINENLINTVSGLIPEGLKLKTVNVSYTSKVDFKNKFADINTNGNLSVKNLDIEDEKTKSPVVPKIDVEVKHDVAVGNPKTEIKDLTLTLSAKNKQPESITLKGDVLQGKTKDSPMTIKMNVNSASLTIDNYLGEVKKDEKTAEKKPSEEPQVKKEEKELEPLDLDFIDFTGNIDMKSIIYKKIKITDLKIDPTLKKSIFEIKNLTLKMNEAPANAKIKAALNVPGWNYSLSSQLTKLDVTPVLESFAPQYKEKVTGKATGNIELSGQGVTQANLEKNLAGTIKGDLTDGEIAYVNILNSLADLLKMEELKKISFFKSEMDILIEKGKLNINKMDFIGNIETLGVRGWVGLNQTLELYLTLGVGQSLTTKLKDIQYLKDIVEVKDKFTMIPVPIGVGGTLDKPKMSLELKAAVKDTGKKVIKDLFMDQLNKQLDKKSDKKSDKK